MDQDWTEVVIRKKQAKPKNNEDALRTAARTGAQVETVKKYNAGKNSANKSGPVVSTKKLEDDGDDSQSIPKVPREVALRIQQARLQKKWTQAELATKINEKATVVNDYENCKAVPNNQILSKMERALGVKLRGQLD